MGLTNDGDMKLSRAAGADGVGYWSGMLALKSRDLPKPTAWNLSLVAVLLVLAIVIAVAVTLLLFLLAVILALAASAWLVWRLLPFRRSLQGSPVERLTEQYVHGGIDLQEFDRRITGVLRRHTWLRSSSFPARGRRSRPTD